MKNNNIIDLFCGCGGLSLGFEKAGFNPILAIDFWKDAINTYNHNHSENIGVCGDIKDISNEYLKELAQTKGVCGVIGGPPCQGFSTVGKRDVDDPRNTLYKEYCRVVKAINPTFFVLENVRGLLTLNKGSFRDSIINDFSELGYTVTYKLVNAADYGVPQRRYRVFFVGIKNVLFKFPKESNKKVTTLDALSDLPDAYDDESTKHEYKTGPQNEYQRKLRASQKYILNHEVTHHSQATIDIISKIPDGGSIKDLPKEYWNIRKYNKAFERMNSLSQSNTIDTGHRNYFHFSYNRIPTSREIARIQSFPDNYEFLGTKTSQYKQIGNAVPPFLAFIIADSIRKQIGGIDDEN